MSAEKYQEFFDFMYQEHNLRLTIYEMDEIISEAEKFIKNNQPFICRDCEKETEEYRDNLCESCHKWHTDS